MRPPRISASIFAAHNPPVNTRTEADAIENMYCMPMLASLLAGAMHQSVVISDYAPFCLGSQCSYWRWANDAHRIFVPADNETARTEPRRPLGIPDDWIWCPAGSGAREAAGWLAPLVGYCSAGGPPNP